MVNEYAKYSDEELIVQLRDGDHAITDYIMEKYKNLVRSKAQSMYILGADREDLIQEGMPAFLPLRICVCPDRCIQRFRQQGG